MTAKKYKPPEPYQKTEAIHIKIVERPRTLFQKLMLWPKYWIYISQGYLSLAEPLTALTYEGALKEAEKGIEAMLPMDRFDKVVCEKYIDVKELLK